MNQDLSNKEFSTKDNLSGQLNNTTESQTGLEFLSKSRNRSSIFIRIIAIVFFVIVLLATLYVMYNKVSPKPWKSFEGKVCDFGGCRISEINQKYNYWKAEAIKNKKINLCNNVEGIDGGDIFMDRDGAIKQCKLEYAIEVGDVEYCKSLENEAQPVCLGGIAEKFSRPELFTEQHCFKLETNARAFSDCVSRLAKVRRDDSVCNLLVQKKMWFDEQMCRQYGFAETRKDNVRKEASSTTLSVLSQRCTEYKTLQNRADCFIDLIEGTIFNEGHAAFENYCADKPVDNSWEVCFYMSDMGFTTNSAFKRSGEIRQKALIAASSSTEWKSIFCEAIRWHTYGSKGIIDADIKSFGMKECGFDYLQR